MSLIKLGHLRFFCYRMYVLRSLPSIRNIESGRHIDSKMRRTVGMMSTDASLSISFA